MNINFELHLCTISNPRPGLTPGTALRAVGSGKMFMLKMFSQNITFDNYLASPLPPPPFHMIQHQHNKSPFFVP